MGLEILPFSESTDSLAAAHMWAESRLPVLVVLWHSAQSSAPSAPRTHLHPHCSDLTTSLGPEVAPAFDARRSLPLCLCCLHTSHPA